jgi:hypothetical protein
MVPVPFCSATIAAMVPAAKSGQSPAILLDALSSTFAVIASFIDQ